MKRRKTLVIGIVVASLLLICLLNPFKAPSWSPIARITGLSLFSNPSASMEPTLSRGSFIFASGWSYLLRDPQPGDVVVFRYPPDPSVVYVKRIIAAGGSRVSLSKCMAIVNDSPLNEPYVVTQGDDMDPACTFGPVVVPENHYFVLGDNRTNSADSRAWGFLPAANVIARALTR
jgi:signal peptidase I